MKIAMMTNNYKPFVGGVPISVERLSEGLRQRGHEVCIFAPEYGDEVREEDVVRYRTRAKRFDNGMVIPGMWDYRISEEFEYRDFDLIHVHQPMMMGNLAVHYSHKYQIPLIFTYHTRYEEYLHYLNFFSDVDETKKVKRYMLEKSKQLLPKYMTFYANQCSMVFAPSDDMQKHLGQRKVEAPVRVLPTGLLDQAFEQDQEASGAVRRKYLGEKKHLICTVSRLEKEKNLYFLLRAAKKLKECMGEVFQLMIVGDGSETERLKDYAQELGIGSMVAFTGAVPNDQVKDYLFASDLFLFASKSETQGIVLAEAMAAGRPVVAVEACGVSDIMADGENGYMTEENEEVFAKRAAKILTDKNLKEKLETGARNTAEAYRASNIARQAEEEYFMVLEKERRRHYYGFENGEKKGTISSFLQLFKTS